MRERTPLAEYRRKRDFAKTPEPFGEAPAAGSHRFVIQKHAARRLHFDLRLEVDGVLKSWAVTREPTLDPGVKRLAVRTEDHPLQYATFEGVIPGGYGAGVVEIWDEGRWRSGIADASSAIEAGKFEFELQGKRLAGAFVLVRLKDDTRRQEQWLLIKRHDEKAEATASGTLQFVPPQLARRESVAPSGDAWLHEVKFDGYRMQAIIENGACRLLTRSGLDWTDRYPDVAKAASLLPARDAIIDGELCALDPEGRPSFSLLRKDAGPVVFWLFDLLHLDGRDRRAEPLHRRKSDLRRLLGSAPAVLRFSDHVTGGGSAYATKACELGLEGIISKRADAPYVSGRSETWIKIKCRNTDDYRVIGWSRSPARGRPFSSLLLAEDENGALRYRGKVGSGFDGDQLERVAALLRTEAIDAPPVAGVPPADARGVQWVRPRLAVQVSFAEKSAAGLLRHATFEGVREDVMTTTSQRPRRKTSAATARPVAEGDLIEGVRITHPERVIVEEPRVTKLEVARYYRDLAPHSLPHSRGRLVSLVRCPEGVGGECFFQKHPPQSPPDAMTAAVIRNSKDVEKRYISIENAAGLVAGVQIGAVEMHIWGSRLDRLEQPDRLVFDLDPDESLGFDVVRDAAFGLREALDALALTSFPMLTGGKGVHVVAPLTRRRDWTEVKAFARAFAERMAAAAPALFVAEMSKTLRVGRIFIDWMRNQRGATAIMPYALRARSGASVAAPVSWRELKVIRRADQFDVRGMARRVAAGGYDPWPGYFDLRQSISAEAMRRLTSAEEPARASGVGRRKQTETRDDRR